MQHTTQGATHDALRLTLFSRNTQHCMESWAVKNIRISWLFYSTTSCFFKTCDMSRLPINLTTNNMIQTACEALWDPDLPHQPHSPMFLYSRQPRPLLVPQMCPNSSCHKAFENTVPSAWSSLPPASLPKSPSSYFRCHLGLCFFRIPFPYPLDHTHHPSFLLSQQSFPS